MAWVEQPLGRNRRVDRQTGCGDTGRADGRAGGPAGRREEVPGAELLGQWHEFRVRRCFSTYARGNGPYPR
ncbi:predicted protein [Streptomyces filamentosus NRRL 15998]|uniref:Predicted protein n=1 Tax=Streptomyces filamentosus NRRL 15998 TaxID=457431 RepID=D6AET9_STRFL|nr:predicted protein [Streptomyces filamentosus NRRL 15998]